MIKLIATDIDGTLVKDGTLQIDAEYMTVIEQLIRKGIHVAVCSGRQFVSEQKLFAPVRNELLYITDGGTVVRTPKEILQVSTMPEDVWKGMCQMVHENLPDCDCYISTPDMGYAENENSQMFHWLKDSYGYDICAVEDLIACSPADVIKFTVYHPSACEEKCAPLFTPTWKDQSLLACSGKEWIDCNPLGVSKWTALSCLQKYLGILPEETCAFGDNLNDMEMLENAGLSFAVSNSREEVRIAAKEICPPYWENGVLQVLKRFL